MEYVSTAKWRPACAKATASRERRWLVCRSHAVAKAAMARRRLGEGWRLFSTFPAEILKLASGHPLPS